MKPAAMKSAAEPIQDLRARRSALLLLAPTLGILLAFLLIPYLNMIVMSFRMPSTTNVFAPGYTMGNYIDVLFDEDLYYLEILWDTLVLGCITTFFCLILGLPVAYHLARSRSRMSTLLYAFVLSPLLVGVVVRCYGWIILLANNEGLINASLRSLGLIDTHLPLLYNTFGVTVGLVHIFLPFMILPLTGAIQSIDPALEEASRSLGASKLKTFWRVIVPLSLPGIQAGTILVFVLTISSYVIPILLGGFGVVIMSTLVVQQLIDAMLWPFGAALAFILAAAGTAVVWVYLVLTNRLMRGVGR